MLGKLRSRLHQAYAHKNMNVSLAEVMYIIDQIEPELKREYVKRLQYNAENKRKFESKSRKRNGYRSHAV